MNPWVVWISVIWAELNWVAQLEALDPPGLDSSQAGVRCILCDSFPPWANGLATGSDRQGEVTRTTWLLLRPELATGTPLLISHSVAQGKSCSWEQSRGKGRFLHTPWGHGKGGVHTYDHRERKPVDNNLIHHNLITANLTVLSVSTHPLSKEKLGICSKFSMLGYGAQMLFKNKRVSLVFNLHSLRGLSHW
jgi:hypothetical protein